MIVVGLLLTYELHSHEFLSKFKVPGGHVVLLVEWALCQVRHWLVAPPSSVWPFPQHILQAGQIIGQRFCGWVGVQISLSVACACRVASLRTYLL